MDELANGIVLKSHRYSETSLILRWLTLELGRIDTLARGALRPKSSFRGKLDLFYLAEFSFVRSRRSELHTLREVRLRQTFTPLRADLPRLQQASYASALVSQTTEPGPPIPEIFQLLSSFLHRLAQQPASPILPLAFELKLLAALGLQPDPAHFPLSAPARQLASACLDAGWSQLDAPPLHPTRELFFALQKFLEFHLDHVPAQRKSLMP